MFDRVSKILLKIFGSCSERLVKTYMAVRGWLFRIYGYEERKDVKKLVDQLQDASEEKRVEAVKKLGRLGPKARKAVPQLVNLLCDDFCHEDVGKALIEIGKPAVPELKKALLNDRNNILQVRAANTLGTLGTIAARAAADLGRSLHSKNIALREAVAEALVKLDAAAQPALPYLVRALPDKNSRVRVPAVLLLERLDLGLRAAIPRIVNLPLKRLLTVIPRGVNLLLERPRPKARAAIPHLVNLLSDDVENIRRAALNTLVKFGTCAVPQLIKALSDDCNVLLQEWASRTLGSIGANAAEAAPDLRRILYSTKMTVRKVAMETLEKIGKGAIPELVKTLADDRDDVLQEWAGRTLGSIGAEAVEAAPNLSKALDSKKIAVREAATKALVQLGIMNGWYCNEDVTRHTRQIICEIPRTAMKKPIDWHPVPDDVPANLRDEPRAIALMKPSDTELVLAVRADNVVDQLKESLLRVAFAFYDFENAGLFQVCIQVVSQIVEERIGNPFVVEQRYELDEELVSELFSQRGKRSKLQIRVASHSQDTGIIGHFAWVEDIPEVWWDRLLQEWKELKECRNKIAEQNPILARKQYNRENIFKLSPILSRTCEAVQPSKAAYQPDCAVVYIDKHIQDEEELAGDILRAMGLPTDESLKVSVSYVQDPLTEDWHDLGNSLDPDGMNMKVGIEADPTKTQFKDFCATNIDTGTEIMGRVVLLWKQATVTLGSSKVTLTNDIGLFIRLCNKHRMAMIRTPATQYSQIRDALASHMEKMHGQSTWLSGVHNMRLFCSSCCIEFSQSMVNSIHRTDGGQKEQSGKALRIDSDNNILYSSVDMRGFSCERCGGSDIFAFYDNWDPGEISPSDADALRKFWRARANMPFWQSKLKVICACNICDAPLSPEASFLMHSGHGGYDTMCGSCCDNVLDSVRDNLRRDPFYLGRSPSELRGARAYAAGQYMAFCHYRENTVSR
jgi:HEAT repeat protein